MSCFCLPNCLINEIEVLIRRFWWGQGGERGKMHWLSSNFLCQAKNSGGLGFRELGSFNEALLAKQVWRLMHNKTSLFYKVFQAKYFLHCSVLDAKLSARGSFAWKRIMGARQVIKKGSIWRVGNGDHIRIWGERWLPVAHHHTIISPRPQQTTVTHVAHLFAQDTRVWNIAVVKANFLPFEAEIILRIPLCNIRNNNMLIWGGTKTGHYAVRSGYHMLLEDKQREAPRTSNAAPQTQVWKSIWSFSIPSKVRHFIWRACRDSLPTRKNLHHRHVLDDPRCPNCSNSVENNLHALWKCKKLQPIWQSIPWGHRLGDASYIDFMDLYYRNMQILQTQELQIFAMLTWLIWFRRNR
jgi:hypothetical protein